MPAPLSPPPGAASPGDAAAVRPREGGAAALVSVLVPVYNHARYLERCLDSLLEDGYPALEVVLMDDGSLDDSYAVAERWRARHPDAFVDFRLHRQENQGLTRTMNRLIGLSRGEFIAWTASDDFLLPGGIAARVDALRAHPEWLAVFADCRVVDEENRPVHGSGLTELFRMSKRRLLGGADARAMELITNWGVPGPVFLARRSAYDPRAGVGLYDESLAVEDRDFYLRLVSRDALGFVDRTVSAYRVSPASLCRAPETGARVLEGLVRTEERHLALFGGARRLALRVHLEMTRCQQRRTRARGLARAAYRLGEKVCYHAQRPIAAFDSIRRIVA